MTQDENEKLLQDPRVAALLKAIDMPVENYGFWFETVRNVRAAFDPPVEMEYTMPSWEDFIVGRRIANNWCVAMGNDAVTKSEYNALREATKRPKPTTEKLGRELWVNVYSNGNMSGPYRFEDDAICAIKDSTMKGKTIRVREVLE